MITLLLPLLFVPPAIGIGFACYWRGRRIEAEMWSKACHRNLSPQVAHEIALSVELFEHRD